LKDLRKSESCPDFRDIFLFLQSGQSDTTDGFRLEAVIFLDSISCAFLGLQFKTLEFGKFMPEAWPEILGRDKTIKKIER